MLATFCAKWIYELTNYKFSTSMYGAMLDQIIFEHLVERTMPILDNHIKKTDVQLSIACLPWFLSLFINSMPLLYAFRVLDCFFMEGPRILFQIGFVLPFIFVHLTSKAITTSDI
jgi:hypothetical protein